MTLKQFAKTSMLHNLNFEVRGPQTCRGIFVILCMSTQGRACVTLVCEQDWVVFYSKLFLIMQGRHLSL